MARADADVDLAVDGTVDVRDPLPTRRRAYVEKTDARLVGLDREARDTHGERLQVPDDLRAFVSVDVRDVAQVPRIRIDRLAIALEAHRAETQVAEDLRRRRDLVGLLKLAVGVLDLL